MPIANGLVQALIRNDLQHVGAPGPGYELVVMDADEAIKRLITVWDQMSNFEEWAAAHQTPKACALAATFVLEVPVLISALPRRLAQPEWGWAQPGSASPDDRIVLEGNNRMLAVALRASWRMPLPRCVGVFVAAG